MHEGKGGEAARKGDTIAMSAKYCQVFEGQSEGEEDGGREGHNTTIIRHDNDKQQQRAQNTQTKS